jgi:anti-sigma B factor antagonist
MTDFKYQIEKTSESGPVVKLTGRLMDEETAHTMLKTVENLIDDGNYKLTLDLAKLEYLNSSGLNSLVNLLTKARSKGGDVVLTALSEKVKSLFIVTKLNTVFTVVDSVEEATDYFKNN